MTKKFLVFAFLATIAFALAACTGGPLTTTASWSISGNVTNTAELDSWHVAARRINGHVRRNIEIDDAGLSHFRFRSTSTSGEITITLTQGDNEHVIDISGNKAGDIDLRYNDFNFEPGRIRVRLDFNRADDVDVFLWW